MLSKTAILLLTLSCLLDAVDAHAEDQSDASTDQLTQDSTEVPIDRDGTFNVVWENDVIANTDRNYTNGIRFSWLTGTREPRGFSRFLAKRLLNVDADAKIRRGFAFGQSIFTPADILASDPLPNQHPYAGWLYGEYSLLVEQRDIVDRLSIQAGIVGPSAGGEWVQDEIHSLIDVDIARGWDNQLADEAGVVLAYDRTLRAIANFGMAGFGVDITPSYGISLGNVHSNARVGLTARFGQDLRNDFGPPRIRPSLAGAGFFTPKDGWGWYLFAGVGGRAVAHNIFLDGSLFRDDDPSVTKESFVADFQGGLVVQVGGVQFSLSYVGRTDEFEEQLEPQRFGALGFSMKF